MKDSLMRSALTTAGKTTFPTETEEVKLEQAFSTGTSVGVTTALATSKRRDDRIQWPRIVQLIAGLALSNLICKYHTHWFRKQSKSNSELYSFSFLVSISIKAFKTSSTTIHGTEIDRKSGSKSFSSSEIYFACFLRLGSCMKVPVPSFVRKTPSYQIDALERRYSTMHLLRPKAGA
jgi:hypothetical protein